MLPKKPFYLRAVYEWIVASECTPYIVVDTLVDYVTVPKAYIQNDQIVLDLSPRAIRDLKLENQYIYFRAKFDDEVFEVYVPMQAVEAILVKETGWSMSLNDEGSEEEGHPLLEPLPFEVAVNRDGAKKDKASTKAPPHLTVIK